MSTFLVVIGLLALLALVAWAERVDWREDRGWKGVVYALGALSWRGVAILISLAIFALILAGWFLLALGVFS